MEKQKQQQSQRLQSLDALRGFDMLFIMGGGSFFVALNTLFPNAFFGAIAVQMEHVKWNGFTCYDMIFPLFLFVSGISFPFSLVKQRKKNTTKVSVCKNIIRRGIILVLLGVIVFGGILTAGFENARYASVLGRIGFAWMFAALIFINTRIITRVGITIGILIGYWLLLAFVPAPDGNGAGVFTMEGSLVGYIDRILLPGRLLLTMHDPEGILSTVPAIATALLGMFTGEYIKWEKNGLTPEKKVLHLLLCGVLLVVVGLLWNLFFPINKNLWTSSFVCFVGGLSILLFALFYYIIDVKNIRKWTLFFTVIGMNSITIYLVQSVLGFENITEFLISLTSINQLLSKNAQSLMQSIGYIAFCWAFLYILYRRRIFLKI